MLYSKVGPEKGVWKVPMEGGNPVRLSDRDAHRPAISPDGTMIAYAYKDAFRNIRRAELQLWHSKEGQRQSISTFRARRCFGGPRTVARSFTLTGKAASTISGASPWGEGRPAIPFQERFDW